MVLRQLPERRMELSFALLQSLEILQMPHQELSDWLRDEIERNPLLELNLCSCSSKKEEFPEIASTPSLYEHLKQEIRDTFLNPLDRQIAEELIGHFDERGFFSTSTQEISLLFQTTPEHVESILFTLQSFDPPGIGARNLQEALLIQLRRQGQEKSLAYRLVHECFDDLLHGRYTLLKKKGAASSQDISAAIQKLARLQLRPAAGYKEPLAPSILPDLRVIKVEQEWLIDVAEEELPPIQIRADYLSLKLKSEEKNSFRAWMTSAKWMIRSLSRRRKLLHTLASYLVSKQADFLDLKGPLKEISAQDLAILVGVHESTIHRALSGKMIEGPWGLIPIRSLLSQSAAIDGCKQLLQRLVEHENKKKPFTDLQIAKALQQKGFTLARRTVAKYRRELKIGSAIQRKTLCVERVDHVATRDPLKDG